jgi:hypothetical protein
MPNFSKISLAITVGDSGPNIAIAANVIEMPIIPTAPKLPGQNVEILLPFRSDQSADNIKPTNKSGHTTAKKMPAISPVKI